MSLQSKRMDRKASLRVAGLFAGIGGIELGLSKAGHHAKMLCEIDDAARAVLNIRFPEHTIHRDVKSLASLGNVDLLAAGFPCQDLSQAGRALGMKGNQSSLVAHVFRLLRKRPVEWVLLENVPFMLQLGKGHAMELLVEEFEELGYKWAYRVIDSRSFGIPQRRLRVYFLASLTRSPMDILMRGNHAEPDDSHKNPEGAACGFYWTEGSRGLGWAVNSIPTLKGGSAIGIPSPPAIWLPTGEMVQPDIRDAERLQGFAPDWTKPAESVARPSFRWKLVGNAVTVDVAEWIGQRLADSSLASEEVKNAGELRKGTWPYAAWNGGDGRRTVNIGTWPVSRRIARLDSYLKFPYRLLSSRAASGFLQRFKASSLSKPPGFVHAMETHLERVGDLATGATNAY